MPRGTVAAHPEKPEELQGQTETSGVDAVGDAGMRTFLHDWQSAGRLHGGCVRPGTGESRGIRPISSKTVAEDLMHAVMA